MKIAQRMDIGPERLPGRIIQKCVGRDAAIESKKMTVGFARYCEEAGPMEPHQHAEETVYILNAERAWVRFGKDRVTLSDPEALEAGMTLHFPELEWHVFDYEAGGFLEIIFFYGQTEGIRPEEILSSHT